MVMNHLELKFLLIIIAAIKKKIQYLTLFAFSTENWKRPSKEINYLFNLLNKYIDKEVNNLLEKGLETGKLIDQYLNKMATRNSFDCIGDVRALGCMNAIELVKNKETCEPDGELAAKVAQIALKNGLILVTAGPTRNVIRLLVPLTASKEVVTEGLKILEASLEEACV